MDILEDADEVARRLKEQADSAAMNAQQQADLIRSEIRKNISNAFKDFALAIKAQTGANIDTFTALVEGIVNGNDQGGGAGASKGSASGSR
jgi:hypothetical protein